MAKEQTWTIQEILSWTTQYFREKSLSSPRLDAELLLSEVCHCTRMDLYLNADKPLSPDERSLYREMVRSRIEGVPVAYLTEKKEFWSLTLWVHRGVLIPRPDTETLVDVMCRQIRHWQNIHTDQPCFVVELGTGSGAIPLALCSELENLKFFSIDVSKIALETALKNMNKYEALLASKNNAVHLVQGEYFEMLAPRQQFDFIIGNPPYIPSDTIPQLQKEVSLYEPAEALDGGQDGLNFYRYLFKNGTKWLKSNGEILLETGFDQEQELKELLSENGEDFQLEAFIKDLQSHPRVIHLRKVN